MHELPSSMSQQTWTTGVMKESEVMNERWIVDRLLLPVLLLHLLGFPNSKKNGAQCTLKSEIGPIISGTND
jgi:hypothetical protein